MSEELSTARPPENSITGKTARALNNTQNMIRVFQAFKTHQRQLGKPDDGPEILYIDGKIAEFKEDVQILKKRLRECS